jgi:hypothetical protein
MRLLWANPAALGGLALLAVPVLIHLMLRPQILRLRFPSLRFLPASRLASARRRVVHDWPLLLVRMAMLAGAVAALAGPILVTPARTAAWSHRVARAVIVETPAGAGAHLASADEAVNEALADADTALRIDVSRLADGMVAADAWLAGVPPAAREVVLFGGFRDGSISARDLDALGRDVGVRFVRLPAGDVPAAEVRVLTFDAGTPVERRHMLAFDDGAVMSPAGAPAAVALPLRVEASAAERQLLDAAIEAVLAEGLFIEGEAVPVMVAWGAAGEYAVREARVPSSPPVRAALDRLIRAAGPSRAASEETDPAPWVPVWPGRLVAAAGEAGLVLLGRGALGVDDALGVARASLRAMYAAPELDRFEPRAIPSDLLDEWTRPAAPPDVEAVARAGRTDSRWVWGLVLLLMAVEQWMRRPRRDVPVPAARPATEARVA